MRTVFPNRIMPEPKPVDDRIACPRGTIERLGRYATGVSFITNTGPLPRGDIADAMRVVAAVLRQLRRVAADNGVLMALEPLDPSSVDMGSAIWTLARCRT